MRAERAGQEPTHGRAVLGAVAALFAVSCAAFGSPEPATPGPSTGVASVEQPPARTALSDGAYCLVPSDAGFDQVSCATGKPFPNGSILADGGKVCFEIDKRTRTLLPVPCAGGAVAVAGRSPGQGPTSILPPLPGGRLPEKPLEGTTLCTEDTRDGLKMLVECSKAKGKPPPTLKLCERLVEGVRYVVPCE